jgi:NTP pyrophosphatase (non-canonical NTP hydrolase)
MGSNPTKETKVKSEKRTSDIKEALRILQEENAEVIQAVSKIFRFGEDTRWPSDNITNLEQLELEIGDIFCVIDILMEKGYIRKEKVLEYAKLKREKLKTWSKINL